MRLLTLLAVLALSGCATFAESDKDWLRAVGEAFENRVACSLDRTEAYVISKWGPVALAPQLSKRDVAGACPPASK
jgi:hypothetical protein